MTTTRKARLLPRAEADLACCSGLVANLMDKSDESPQARIQVAVVRADDRRRLPVRHDGHPRPTAERCSAETLAGGPRREQPAADPLVQRVNPWLTVEGTESRVEVCG